MALSFTLLDATPSTTNASSYASASVAPTANRLLLVGVLTSRGASTDPVVPTLSGNGIAYDHVDDGVTEGNNLFVASGTLRYRLCLFFALTGATPSAGAVTVDLGGVTHTGCAIIVAQSNEEVDLADAIVQVDLVAPGFVASAAAAMAAFADAANAAFSVWALDAIAAITHEGTELADITYSTPAARLQAQFLASEDTTPGVSWTGNANVGGIAVEVRIDAGGGTVYDDAPSGGLVMGGTVAQDVERSSVVSGGIVMGGTIAQDMELDSTVSGGIALAGSVTSTLEVDFAPSGGIVLGGAAASDLDLPGDATVVSRRRLTGFGA